MFCLSLSLSLWACSSAMDVQYNMRVALKKLSRPFQTSVHAKRTYRELRYLKHLKHENVGGVRDRCGLIYFIVGVAREGYCFVCMQD